MLRTAALAAIVACVGVGPAAADDPVPAPAAGGPDYFARKQPGSGVVTIRRDRTRCRADRLLIGGLLGGAALGTAVGVYFHLDSRRIANDLSADSPTGRRWSDALDARYERGQRAGTVAIGAYVVAGALVVGALVAIWKTDPGTELVEARVVPTAAVVPGGGTLGAAWQF